MGGFDWLLLLGAGNYVITHGEAAEEDSLWCGEFVIKYFNPWMILRDNTHTLKVNSSVFFLLS